MNWLIASDVHGSGIAAGLLKEAFEREKAEKLLLLGDLLYHGPRNDLPEGYGPMKAAEILNSMAERIMCVRGNCDAEVDQMVLSFPLMDTYLLFDWCGSLAFATHGHVYDEGRLPPIAGVRFFLSGHTHVPVLKKSGPVVFLNPGSAAIPKGGSRPSYALLSKDRAYIKELKTGEIIKELALF